jgi:glycosyltransferase involved in cell wall biosynthesis
MARWANGVSVVIAGSEHLLRKHDEMFPTSNLSVIRLPITAPPSARASSPHWPPVTIGYLGALTLVKGLDLLLAAAPSLAAEGVQLRVAGDGPLREQVVDALGSSYVGQLQGSAKWDFMLSCDLGVVPSLWEEPSGPPYVVCEWLAIGRPVLVTPRGGLIEAADRGGVVAFDPSPESLLGAVRALRRKESASVLAPLPVVNDDEDHGRWLDEHEAAYRLALK